MDFGNIIHIAPSNQNTSNILSESKKKKHLQKSDYQHSVYDKSNYCLPGQNGIWVKFSMRTLDKVQVFLPLLTIQIFKIFPPSYVVSKLSYSHRALVSKCS